MQKISVTYGATGSENLLNKKAVLPQGNRAMPQVFFSVEVRQQHSLLTYLYLYLMLMSSAAEAFMRPYLTRTCRVFS